ncbi:MAG: GNAT family N-acetyltransferase [Verrucomicrobia bacterium]|nr:GNAT family N-acetyltransferase [Verrucomicrobiota bacterium]MBV8276840.1 GNAT family N-acetyltransferase [Verrucomicrobiota bacterium]
MLAIPHSIADGGRIALAPVQASQVKELYEAITESSAELSPWMEWLHPDYSIAETEQWVAHCQKAWEADSSFGFTVVEQQTNQILGGCGITFDRPAHRNGSIGYWIRTSRTKQGFAAEAASLLAQFGFAQLGLIRIEIFVAAGNVASQRVAEKVGALREGLLRNRLLLRGQPQDAYVFSLIP